jgi:uncharacterized membrane protein
MTKRMFPKARLDALHDGIFSVAMTLLVLDVRLPDDFSPANDSEFLHGLLRLWPKFLPYVLSFGVLGLRWLAGIQVRSKAEYVNREYVNWWLLYLLLITFVPFSTIMIGRYAHLAPTTWLYAGNTLLIALISIRIVTLTPEVEQGAHLRGRMMSAAFLAVSSLLAIIVSLFEPGMALWAFALNFAQPLIERWRRHRAAAT